MDDAGFTDNDRWEQASNITKRFLDVANVNPRHGRLVPPYWLVAYPRNPVAENVPILLMNKKSGELKVLFHHF